MREEREVAVKTYMKRGTKTLIKVLLLEDAASDIELIKYHLELASFEIQFESTGTKDEFERLLHEFEPDVVISDYQLPSYSGQDALEYTLMHAPDTPFILVTGALGEEKAVQMIQAGAADFLLKQNLHNLPATMLRALRLSDEKRAKNLALDLMERSEMHFRGLIENSYDPILVFDSDGVISYGSPSFMRLLGYSFDEVTGRQVTDFIYREDVKVNLAEYQMLLRSEKNKVILKQRLIQRSGELRWVEAVLTDQRKVPGVGAFVGNLRDIHEFIAQREELYEKNILLNSVLDSLSEGVVVSNQKEEFILFNKAAEKILNVGKSEAYLDAQPKMHTMLKEDEKTPYKKEELPLIQALHGRSLDEVPMIVKHEDNRPDLHLSVHARPLLGRNNKIVGGIASFRDVTKIHHYQRELENTLSNLEQRVRERTEELLLAHQKLRDAHRHMTYSINYAQKIQQAITPSHQELQQTFGDAFMFYRPKDIVSGDYIWLNTIGGNHLAVVDCTGHGVPGAMMSMIGLELLERIVQDRRIHRVEIILEELDKAVTQLMKREGTSNAMNDGMDLSICSFDFDQMELNFAGAYNNAVLLRKDETVILNADKHSIGGFMFGKRKEFGRTVQPFSKGDRLYMFTDGFQDQFGGPKTRKFTKRRLIELIESNRHLNMKEQKDFFEKTFDEWKGNQMQIDDVTLVGVEL